MFCGKCGKKVNDDMLFCPFCGNAIVVPEQDDEDEAGLKTVKGPDDKTEPKKPRRTVSLFDEDEPEDEPDEEPEAFVPLSEDDSYASSDLDEPESYDEPEDFSDDDDDEPDDYDADDPIEEEPVKPQHRVPRMNRQISSPANSRRGSYIPVRNTKSEDMYLGTEEDEYDSDDEYDDFDDEYDEAEEPKESFFKRHLPLVITGAVILVLLAGAVGFSFSPAGQKMLARVNLAWTAQGYASLGYDEHTAGNYAKSAQCYVRAHEMDGSNYEYAHSAMVAYYEAEDIDDAAQMAITCINLKPDDAEPYRELRTLYGNGEIPAIARNYIQQGYQKTGDEYLNLSNSTNT